MSEHDARAVILAAGTSSRMGAQKLLMPFRGRPLIEHAIAAVQGWRPLVVAGAEVFEFLAGRDDVELVHNDEPARGMSHSLRLASNALADEVAMIVLLGDKPLITPALIDAVVAAAGDADVAYPARDDEPGHPVWISRRARRRIAELPDGDTLRLLREQPGLALRAVDTEDEGAFFDVDTLDRLSS